MLTVLVIDDDRSVRELVAEMLRCEGMRVLATEKPQDGLHFLQYDSVDVVLTDLRLPGEGGMEVLDKCRRLRPFVPVILITGFGTVESAVQAMRLGACDYITKPLSRQKLVEAIHRARSNASANEIAVSSTRSIAADVSNMGVIARSPALCEVLRLVDKIAPTKASVLIEGETGVGKELVARRIHSLSDRRDGPFVRVSCGAIPEDLFESELFGDDRGKFAGTDQGKIGCLEMARHGTLFLDEVGELPGRMQSRLHQALQEGRFFRLGGSLPVELDLRVISTSTRNLQAEAQEELFRKDLYFRLNLVSLRIPPLRERPDDVAALIEHFIAKLAEQHGRAEVTLNQDVVNRLLVYSWPGNVHELSNVLELAIILSDGKTVEVHHLPEALQVAECSGSGGDVIAVPLAGNMKEIERHLIKQMIVRCKGNKAEAARRLGMHRRTLYRVMNRDAELTQQVDAQPKPELTEPPAECA